MKELTIIFDLDGTLLNTDELIFKSFEHVFQTYFPGHKLSKDELLSFLGPSLVESFSKYSDNVDELIDCYREYNHAHHKDYVTIYPHVKETLEVLSNRGYKLAVVTTKLKYAAYLGLDLFDITKYFDVIIGIDDVTNTKPDPEGIFKALSMTNQKNGVMIGDNVTDIKAGKNAGVYTIGVKWSPKGYQEIEKLKPDLLIDDMKEIIKFIEGV
jgi:pyrophosphatase PpaX